MIAACNQTDGMANTWAIPIRDNCGSSGRDKSRFGSASQTSRAAPHVMTDNNRIICRNVSVRCARLTISLSAGSRAANKVTMNEPITAATSPLPPSSKPKARPWESLLPHSRVARINGAQNRAIVVIPQYAYRITSVDGGGTVIITRPPAAVDVNATASMVRAQNLSAIGPPKKYAAIATTP